MNELDFPRNTRYSNMQKSINVILYFNRMKKLKHQMIISIHEEKACSKIQHPSMMKTLNKITMQGNALLKVIKVIFFNFTILYWFCHIST